MPQQSAELRRISRRRNDRRGLKHIALVSLAVVQLLACSENADPPAGQGGQGGSAAASGGSQASGGAGTGTGGAATGGGPVIEDPIPGFRADYFFQYRELAHSTIEEKIEHVWTGENTEPAPGVGGDHFSVRYSAQLRVDEAGTYGFATVADDGVRLWIDERLVIDDWRPHAAERHEGVIELTPGEVSLRLEYYEDDYGAEASLFWTRPGNEESILDASFVTAIDGSAVAPKPPYRNAVIPSDRPDPGVLADGNPPVYYMVSTGGRFHIRKSYDLVFWEDTNAFVLAEGKPSWAANGGRNWAPELHKVGDRYVAYYTSVNGANVLSIGAASADAPTGPFTDLGAPLVEHAQGVIDASFFEDSDGKRYLTYKIDGNAHGQATPIYLRELSADGLSFAPGSTQVEILRNDSTTWEGGVVEGQWIVKRGDTYFLFYSGNVYDQRYRTGVARSSSLTGPYQKHGAPILTNNDDWVGPGHGSVVPAGDALYFIYHAWVENGSGGRVSESGRHVLVDKIDFIDNWPVISGGSPSHTLQPWPGY